MSKRIKLLLQSRISFKTQLQELSDEINNGTVGNTEMKLRIAQLTESYREFVKGHDELMIENRRDEHVQEFKIVQRQFFSLATTIDDRLHAANGMQAIPSGSTNTNGDSMATELLRYSKLPEIKLPNFDGKFENWVFFKGEFNNVIASRKDLSDGDKLQYLKSALIGDAARKLKIFSADGSNYMRAWEVLSRTYEDKRLLITSHINALFNVPKLENETCDELFKLVDDIQQHVSSLGSLEINITPEILVILVENKLPKSALIRWERTLKRGVMPSLEDLYEFIIRSAVCASQQKKRKMPNEKDNSDEMLNKKKRFSMRNKVFISDMKMQCLACKSKVHPLYMCNKFKEMSVLKRIDLAKQMKVCFNCLRSHPTRSCRFPNCRKCQRHHNTLLHFEKNEIENIGKKGDITKEMHDPENAL